MTKKITLRAIIYRRMFLSVCACNTPQEAVHFPPVMLPTTVAPVTSPGELTVYPSPDANLGTPEHLTQYNDYAVEVKKTGEITYKTCFVDKSDNYWADIYFGSSTKSETSASFTSFASTGTSVDVKVTSNATAGSVIVRPLNFGINPVRNGSVITFTISDRLG